MHVPRANRMRELRRRLLLTEEHGALVMHGTLPLLGRLLAGTSARRPRSGLRRGRRCGALRHDAILRHWACPSRTLQSCP